MQIDIDPDVAAAAAMLQANFEAGRLVALAEALAKLAPALWGHHGAHRPIQVAALRSEQIIPSERGRLVVANG